PGGVCGLAAGPPKQQECPARVSAGHTPRAADRDRGRGLRPVGAVSGTVVRVKGVAEGGGDDIQAVYVGILDEDRVHVWWYFRRNQQALARAVRGRVTVEGVVTGKRDNDRINLGGCSVVVDRPPGP